MGPSNSQRGVSDTFRPETPSVLSTHFSGIGTPSASRSDSKASGEKGGRKGLQSEVPRFLQPSLPGSQEERRVQACDRSVILELLSGQQIFQDGNARLHSGIHSALALGSIIGSLGCVLSCTNPPQLQEVPPVLPQPGGLPIPGSPLRPSHRSKSFHQTHGSSGSLSQAPGFDPPSVLRRLAASSAQLSNVTTGSGVRLVETPIPGPSSKREEIRPRSFTGLHLRRDEFSDGFGQDKGPTSQGGKPSPSGRRISSSRGRVRKRVSFSCGSPGSRRSTGRARSTSPSPYPVLPGNSVVPKPRSPGRSNSDPSRPPAPPPLVAGQRPVRGRSPSDSSTGVSPTYNGRESVRLGSTPRASRANDFGFLDPGGISPTHQQPGNESGQPGLVSLPGSGREPLCHVVDRQHDSGVLHQETGGDSFLLPVPRDQSGFRPVSQAQGFLASQTHSGEVERPGGQSVQEQPTSPIGMVPESGSCQPDLQGPRKADVGPLRLEAQQSVTPVRKSRPRPSSVGSRRAIVRLGDDGGLRLSPVQPDSSGSTEGKVQQLPDPPSSPLVAPEVVVQRPAGAAHGSSEDPAVKGRSSDSKGRTPQRSRHVPPTRLAVIRQALRKKRFSSKASSLIANARRQSTTTVYDAKWKVFADWCARRKVDPTDPSARRLADFFVFLFEEKKLAISTIKGYRSMISHTLAFRSSKVCSDPSISELMRAMELKRPVSRSLTPKWDLSCVLWSLTKAPYEPLDQASLQFLTWKTAFLLTLASSKRRSEIHALSVEDGHCRFNNNNESVTLLTQPGFLAKTQLPSTASLPFTIPSLSDVCGSDDEDRLLCPVRSLRFYLTRVKSLRGRRKRLFIPIKGGGCVGGIHFSLDSLDRPKGLFVPY